jgi:palmitoyltransferase ZDHHC1/11
MVFTQFFLQRPFHKLQISTWVLLPLLFIHYYVFLYPLLWESKVVKVVVTFFFVASSVALLCFGYLCCSTDPSDDALRDLSKGSPRTNNSVYCYICEVNVNKCSKHCRYCGKCVEGLDHHCKWLNTCVGTKNYKFFLAVLGSVTLTTTISVTLSIAYLVEIFAYASSFDVRIARLNGGSQSLDAVKYQAAIPSDGVKGVLIASIAILLPLVALIYQLVGFHIMLGDFTMSLNNVTPHDLSRSVRKVYFLSSSSPHLFSN